MPQSTNPVEAAAADFGRHSKGGGGWALGLAVAACVKTGTGNSQSAKVSAAEFARSSGTSAERVLRYVRAWAKAHELGLVTSAADLTPSDWDNPGLIPDNAEWSTLYDASAAGSRPRDSRPEHAGQIIARRGADAVVAALTDEQIEDVVAAAIEHRPEAAQRGRIRPMVNRARAAGVLPLGGHGVKRMPNEPDVTWMDIDREIGRLHSGIVMLAGWNTTHAEAMRERVDRLQQESDLLGMVVDGARGLSQDDLAEMLGRS